MVIIFTHVGVCDQKSLETIELVNVMTLAFLMQLFISFPRAFVMLF
jgi:hypothetical protein